MLRHTRFLFAAAWCLAWLPAPALAREPGLHLSWVRAPEAASCADASQVEADVERRLGWSPFVAGGGPSASIEILVTRGAVGWNAVIRMRRADATELGTREVTSDSPTCSSLARASGLAIALMIEDAHLDLVGATPSAPAGASTSAATPSAVTVLERAAPASVASGSVASGSVASGSVASGSVAPARTRSAVLLPAEQSPAKQIPAALPPAELPPAAARPSADEPISDAATGAGDAAEGSAWRPGFGLAAGVVCASRVLPGLACGPALNTALHLHPRWAASISVHLLPQQTIARSGARVGFDLTSAALRGCYAIVKASAWSASACASLLAGAMHVSVVTPTPVGAGQRAWWATSLGLQAAWQMEMLEVQVGAEAVAPLIRHDYAIQHVAPLPPTSLFREERLGVLGSVAVGVRF